MYMKASITTQLEKSPPPTKYTRTNTMMSTAISSRQWARVMVAEEGDVDGKVMMGGSG
jgi:hypothetical protein